MRWFVDISAIGSNGGKASRFCVEAEQWQRALQSVRALRGDTSPFASFSIELLEDGYRAIDPATRSRYVVQKAPDDAELTTKPIEVPIIPSVPPPAPSKPRNRTGDGPRSRGGERRRNRLSIPDDPVPRAPDVPGLRPSDAPAARVSNAPAASTTSATPAIPPPPSAPASANGAPRVSAPPPRPSEPARASSPSPAQGSSPAPVRPSGPPPAPPVASGVSRGSVPPPSGNVSRPMQAETAFERMTAGLASFPLKEGQARPSAPPPPSTGAGPDVTTEVLPHFKILSERAEAPTASSPLTYREMAFAVSESTSFKDAEGIVRAQFEVVRASLRHAPKGQFITLAVFDHEFDGKPRRLPLATLSFKDWRDPEPVVRFPLRDVRESTRPSGPVSVPPPSAGPPNLGQTQVNPAASVPIEAKRSDSALPKVELPTAESPKAESPKAESPKAESPKAEPPKAESPKAEPPKAESPKAESPKAESPKAESLKAELPKVDAPKESSRSSAPPVSSRGAAGKAPPPTPSQVRKAAVEMARDDVTEVKEPQIAIPEPPESLTQVMPPPVAATAEPAPATVQSETPIQVIDVAPSDAPTPAMVPDMSYGVGATERGVFPAVTLPSGIAPLAPSPNAAAFGVTAPAEPLSSAMRMGSQPPSAAPTSGPVSSARDTERTRSVPPPSGAAPTGAAPTSVAPTSGANVGVPSKPPPPKGPVSAPPPVRTSAPPASKKRVRDDDLITELFEALSDLEFLADPLEGADFVLSIALDNIPSEVGFVSFFSLDSREFVVVRTSPGAASELILKRAGERASLLSRAMRAHQAVVLTDDAAQAVGDDPRWAATGVTPTSLVCAPVKLGGRYLGLIELANPEDGTPYTSGDGHALSYIAQQFAEFLAQRDVVLDPDRVTAPKLAARVRR